MRSFDKITDEEILFMINCIQTYDSIHNDSGEYDTIIESIIDKLN